MARWRTCSGKVLLDPDVDVPGLYAEFCDFAFGVDAGPHMVLAFAAMERYRHTHRNVLCPGSLGEPKQAYPVRQIGQPFQIMVDTAAEVRTHLDAAEAESMTTDQTSRFKLFERTWALTEMLFALWHEETHSQETADAVLAYYDLWCHWDTGHDPLNGWDGGWAHGPAHDDSLRGGRGDDAQQADRARARSHRLYPVLGGHMFKADPSLLIKDLKCDASPQRTRALGVDTFWWRGRLILACNTGNGISLWDITDPLNWKYVTGSAKLTRGFAGDRDYNLMQFSVADNCRYALASFPGQGTWSTKMGQTLIDLGDGSKPQIKAWRQYASDPPQPEGGCVFSIGGQAYLLSNGMPGASMPTTAGLYTIDSLESGGLTRIQEVTKYDGVPLNLNWGCMVGGYLYVTDEPGNILVYSVVGNGANLRLNYVKALFRAGFTFVHGFRHDPVTMLGATANGSSAWLWDLTNPTLPALLAQIPLPHRVTSVAISGSLLWVGCKGSAGAAWTFDISDPRHPVPLNQEFWDLSHEWNHIGACWYEHDAVIVNGALYLARYSGLQLIDTQTSEPSTGGDPVPTVTPDPNVTPTRAPTGDCAARAAHPRSRHQPRARTW